VVALLLLFSILSTTLHAATADLSFDKNHVVPDEPIDAMLLITHDKSESVDKESASFKGRPVALEWSKTTPIANSSLVVSIYRLELPPLAAGDYTVPPLQITVGSKTIASSPTPLSIAKATPLQDEGEATLSLSQAVASETELYPGVRFATLYTLEYRGTIQLIKEELHLLNLPGFQKIGKLLASEEEGEEGQGLLKTAREYRAITSGETVVPSSKVEGVVYQEDRLGRRRYGKRRLSTKTPPLTIEVLPFPQQGKTPAFTGALGSGYSLETSASRKELNLNERVVVTFTVKGGSKSDMQTVLLPPIRCQVGVSGLFDITPIIVPPTIAGASKAWQIAFTPKEPGLQEIPALAFSSFDPETATYATLKSQPIPIDVVAKPVEEERKEGEGKGGKDKEAAFQSSSIQANMSLTWRDLYNKPFGTWSLFWIFPVGLGVNFLSYIVKQWVEERKRRKKTAQELFWEAVEACKKHNSSTFYKKMRDALLLKLLEEKETEGLKEREEELSEGGRQGQVKQLLLAMEEAEFGKKAEEEQSEAKRQEEMERLINQVEVLYGTV